MEVHVPTFADPFTPAGSVAARPIKLAFIQCNEFLLRVFSSFFRQSPEFELVGAYLHPTAAKESIQAAAPDVVLVDVFYYLDSEIPDVVVAVQRVFEWLPRTKVIVFSTEEKSHWVFESFALGVSAFVEMSTTPERLVEIIREVYSGIMPITRVPISAMKEWFSWFKKSPCEDDRLPAEDWELLNLMEELRTISATCQRLGIREEELQVRFRGVFDRFRRALVRGGQHWRT